MKNRVWMSLVFVVAFMFAAPAAAMEEPVSETTVEEKASTEEKAPEAKTEEKAPAEEGKTPEIQTDEEAVSSVKQVVGAAKEGKWALVAGISIMLLVFILRKMNVISKLPSKMVPWVAAGLSILGYVSAALMVEGVAVTDALIGGFTNGASAVGLWEMVFQHVPGFKKADA